MSELSFLLELLLNHKLSKATKDLIQSRIKEVEASMHTSSPTTQVRTYTPAPIPTSPHSNQAPSTQAMLAKYPDLAAKTKVVPPAPSQEPPLSVIPVDEIAQTPAAAKALADRAALMAGAGKTEPGRSSPKKF